MKICPYCEVASPDGVPRCECGFDLQSDALRYEEAVTRREHEREAKRHRWHMRALYSWIAACVVLLCLGLLTFLYSQPQTETLLGVWLLMMSLGFPLAYMVVPGFVSDWAASHGVTMFAVGGEPWQFLRDWFFLFLLGLVQWYLVLRLSVRVSSTVAAAIATRNRRNASTWRHGPLTRG